MPEEDDGGLITLAQGKGHDSINWLIVVALPEMLEWYFEDSRIRGLCKVGCFGF